MSILSILLLRLVPYFLASWIAYKKGYPYLVAALLWISLIVITNFVHPLSPELRASLGSISALLLLVHTARLVPRK